MQKIIKSFSYSIFSFSILFGNTYQQGDKPLVKIANGFTKRLLFSTNQLLTDSLQQIDR